MATTYKFYHDAAGLQEITSSDPLLANSMTPEDKQIYLRTNDADIVGAQADSDPGVDDIEVSAVDTGTGGSQPVTNVKLATSLAGLATAVAGDPVALGPSIGTVFPVWVRYTPTGSEAVSTNIVLRTNALLDTPA